MSRKSYAPSDRTVASVRRFNRFYTRTLGILPEGHLHTNYSLAEVRILYEIAHRDSPTAREIGDDLALDPGYLSRLIRRLESAELVRRTRSTRDGRESFLTLTARGKTTFDSLDRAARAEVAAVIDGLDSRGQQRLTSAMSSIEQLLSSKREAKPPTLLLRDPEPGDLGWVVERHGAVYAQEYGWNAEFEGLVAKIVGDYALHCDPKRERCWIAELGGERVGSIFLVRKSARVARLRLLLVEKEARGHGIGHKLVEACIAFAREAGYHRITLWTQSILHEAHRIYVHAGFELKESEPHTSFGARLVGETWELLL